MTIRLCMAVTEHWARLGRIGWALGETVVGDLGEPIFWPGRARTGYRLLRRLGRLDAVVLEWVEGPGLERLLVDTVRQTLAAWGID